MFVNLHILLFIDEESNPCAESLTSNTDSLKTTPNLLKNTTKISQQINSTSLKAQEFSPTNLKVSEHLAEQTNSILESNVRGIPLSLVEEESAEISRRIDQGSAVKGSQPSSGIVVHSVDTEKANLSHISGTILVRTANTGIKRVIAIEK